jgi:oligopeptidase A
MNADGVVQAQFYLDLYARQHKRGGAWMADCCSRFRTEDGLQIPVAFMTCNSSSPTGDKPALFTHDEVITLFHEFGHGLHHMLTEVDYLDISGISGVEWDAVELPSQFMENWCWQREALDLFAAHYETGEKIPDELFEKIKAAQHFQSAMGMVRQLEFSLFDLRIHMDTTIDTPEQIQHILDETRKQVSVVPAPAFNRFQNGFTHIFAGGYAAGYYSYKWAEVLSADAFARFEEEGLFSPQVGEDFLTQVLQQGGSRPAMESFVAFRGREPSVDALLRHNGLTEDAA